MNGKHISLALAFSLAIAPHCGEEELSNEEKELTVQEELPQKKRQKPKTIRMSSEPNDFEEDSDPEGDLEFKAFQSCIRTHAMAQMRYEPAYYGCFLAGDFDLCEDYYTTVNEKMANLEKEENTVEICWDFASNPPFKFTTSDPELYAFQDWLADNDVEGITSIPDLYGRVDRILGSVSNNELNLYCRSEDSKYICSVESRHYRNYTVKPSFTKPFTAYDFESGINDAVSAFFNPECYVSFNTDQEPTPDECEYVFNLHPDCGLPFACYEVEEDTGFEDTASN